MRMSWLWALLRLFSWSGSHSRCLFLRFRFSISAWAFLTAVFMFFSKAAYIACVFCSLFNSQISSISKGLR